MLLVQYEGKGDLTETARNEANERGYWIDSMPGEGVPFPHAVLTSTCA